MQSDLQMTDNGLTITRVYKTTPEEMWDYWTDPAKISEWHRPNRTDFTTHVEADPKVGGAYSIAMEHQGKPRFHANGAFKELDPPRKIVFSWQWVEDPTNTVSEVTILLAPVPEGTKLTLVHERLNGPEAVKAHADGWLAGLENISEITK